MTRLTLGALVAGVLLSSHLMSAQRVRQQGRAIVEYSSPQVKALAAYEYSRRNHMGSWVLVEMAVQARERVAIERSQIALVTPDGRTVPLATQQQFLDDHAVIARLLQNASVWRRPLAPYFTVRPVATIRLFSHPGRLVHDSFVSNRDEVASGDLLFTSSDLGWAAGTYQLIVSHPDARVELPIELE